MKLFTPRVCVTHLLLCTYIYRPVLSVIRFATDPNGTTVMKASSWLLNLQIRSLVKAVTGKSKHYGHTWPLNFIMARLQCWVCFIIRQQNTTNRSIGSYCGSMEKIFALNDFAFSLFISLGEVALIFRDRGHRQEVLVSLLQPPSRLKSRCSALTSCLICLYSNYTVITKRDKCICFRMSYQ